MDLDIIQSTKEGEITQFLCDVRDYFKASLATSEYENTSNMFYLTASETTEQLLDRCECLLRRLESKNSILTRNTLDVHSLSPLQSALLKNYQGYGIGDKAIADTKCQGSTTEQGNNRETDNEHVSYLDMSSASNLDKKKHTFGSSDDTNKTFRCSAFVVKQNKSFLHPIHDTMTANSEEEVNARDDEEEIRRDDMNSFEDDTQIYDICQVTTQGSDGEEDEVELEETQKAITSDSHFSLPNVECPYMDLPAGHLSIKKSKKYGQLLKIEKRLFFDQSKKCYCGILNDWLLCYADGPTSNRPTISLYLKIPSIEIEHFGEGKRRDICFQITTCDPNKKFVFQAVNEIDAKEWIHAIEAAIRSDTTGSDIRNSSTRKLPTPPVIKKITFLNSFQGVAEKLPHAAENDYIYEEPTPIIQIITKSSLDNRPELPEKQKNPLELARKFEYDVPKCPPQPIKDTPGNDVILINPYENNKTNAPEKGHTITLSESFSLDSSPCSVQKINLKMEENLDFQAKVKDVHNKLTSQLSNGPNIKKSLKKSLSATLQMDAESLSSSLPISPLPETTDFKKQKKPSNLSNSPQKMSNAKNWFLNRLNKTTSSTRSNSSSPANSPSKCKQSEKENLLNSSSDTCDGYDSHSSNLGNNSATPILKSSTQSSGTSKVNMIINQLEASGHLGSIFNADAIASFSSFCENDCSNYEPIMTVTTPPNNLMKKV